jgi:hypothetical protein
MINVQINKQSTVKFCKYNEKFFRTLSGKVWQPVYSLWKVNVLFFFRISESR